MILPCTRHLLILYFTTVSLKRLFYCLDNFLALVNVDAGKCLIKMWSDKSGFLSFNILKCIQHHFWNEVGKKVNITATPEKRISKMNVRLGVGKPLQKHTLEMKIILEHILNIYSAFLIIFCYDFKTWDTKVIKT